MPYAVTRSVRDSFEAMHMATSMLLAGVEPLSVTVDRRPEFIMVWHVFGIYKGELPADVVAKDFDDRFDTLMGR